MVFPSKLFTKYAFECFSDVNVYFDDAITESMNAIARPNNYLHDFVPKYYWREKIVGNKS